MARGLYPRVEFNRRRDQLPERTRQEVEAVPVGSVGLAVRVVGCSPAPAPGPATYGHVAAHVDPSDALAALERRLRDKVAASAAEQHKETV